MRYELSQHAEQRLMERNIEVGWLEQALEHPALILEDEVDPSLEHRLIVIDRYGGRVLREVCTPTTDPIKVVTVHFDRSMKGKL